MIMKGIRGIWKKKEIPKLKLKGKRIGKWKSQKLGLSWVIYYEAGDDLDLGLVIGGGGEEKRREVPVY
jgi:hypothetical protein